MTLTEQLLRNLQTERTAMAEVVRLLITVEKTRYYAQEGYSSLSKFCQGELGLSQSTSSKRINAARLAARFPTILERLAKNEIHLSALTVLSPHLTEANHLELLDEAKGLSEDELKRRVAARFPSPRKPPTKVHWLNGNEAQLSVVLSADVLALIERVQELRKHAHPDGNVSALLEEALNAYLKQIDPMRKKAPRERKPRRPHVLPRHGRRRTKHLVWHRDQDRCTYVSPTGKRCAERAGLQIDHRQAWADGGSSLDPENLRLLCATHNRYLAEKRFGPRPSG